jgi:Raf kinase inhibitor-like YbhB/YbcL family protein
MQGEDATMELTSPAFEHEGMIPAVHACDGKNVSPELNLSDVPDGTGSLALVMDDPDAPGGTFDHWVVWNIAPDTRSIPRGKEPRGIQGRTGFGRLGYGGPCPPGGTHRYFFRLYALDCELDLRKGARKNELEAAMEGHILDRAELMGRYRRQR